METPVDGPARPSAREDGRQQARVTPHVKALITAQVSISNAAPVATLKARLGAGPFALITLFVSPDADFDAIVTAAHEAFAGTRLIACTTAGEIGARGYEEGQIVAVGYPQEFFATTVYLIAGLDRLDTRREIDRLIHGRLDLSVSAPRMAHEFAFAMIDGLSLREDELTAMLSSGLGNMPFFGGSAGDGSRFLSTKLAIDGEVHANAAIIVLARTHCPVKVFSLDHLVPTEARMVVTEADPSRRIVQRINAEPAAQEYARIVGKDPLGLDRFTFAAHPVVVRVGGRHHVRAIQQVTEAGELVFYSAIDEGMVLTTAAPLHMARHLDEALAALGTTQAPAAILACDCILRRIEASQKQMTRDISAVLQKHHVTGFSTYGEQIGALHVNHTMTGVALYPPDQFEDGA